MNLKTLAALIALSLPLAGCGNNGPLVLPSPPVAENAATLPADATAPTPADPAPTADETAPVTEAEVERAEDNDGDAGDPPPAR